MKIDDETAFTWWVPIVKKNREIVWSKLKFQYWQQTHKYGIQWPNSVKEAYVLDEENKNKLWRKGIKEDMETLNTEIAESTTSPGNLVGY